MKGKSSYLTGMPGIKHFCPSGKATDFMRSRENYQSREEMLNGFIIFLLHDDSGVSFYFGGGCHVGRASGMPNTPVDARQGQREMTRSWKGRESGHLLYERS